MDELKMLLQIEQNKLPQFKNKLASKIRKDYQMFCEIKDVEIEDELGNAIRTKLAQLYELLQNEGINLKGE